MTIVFAAGGSGGHVFPALRVAQELREQKQEVVFVTTSGLAYEMINKRSFHAHCLNVQGVNFSSLAGLLRSIFLIVKAAGFSLSLLKSIGAQKVIGFGGYVSFPVVIAAFLMRRPTAIHEQNVIPGKANVWASFFSKKIMISFDQTRKYFSVNKVSLVGCPCRDQVPQVSMVEIYQKFNFDQKRQTVFVVGGSQGSSKINQEFSDVVIKKDYDFQFIHVCGQKDYDMLNEKYKSFKNPFFLTPFLNEIEQAYQISDLVIARAGAATICELLAFNKRSIIVPYPFAGGHQKANAKVLCDAGLATMILDDELTTIRLGDEIERHLIKHKGDVKKKTLSYAICFDASKKIADTIRALC